MKNLVSLTLVLLAIFATTLLFVQDVYHLCNWEDCEHQWEIRHQDHFIPQWGNEEYSDGWCIEMTHFINPEWDYERCQEYVFEGIE